MILFRSKSLLSTAIVFALLQGCGGGGGGSSSSNSNPNTSNASSTPANNSGVLTPTEMSTPASPAAAVKFALKQLQFSWTAVDGATFYRVLEDANGSGTFTQIGSDMTALAFSRDIALHTFTARYRVQACNSAGCATSETMNAIDYFKASNTGAGDTFGWSLALSDDGNTLAVGAPSEDGSNDGSVDSGAVYVFANSANGWVQQAYLKATTVLAGANFGESVALDSDGKTLAVGAPFEDSSAGSAYVFMRNGTTWSQQSRIKASNAYMDTYFGWTLALSDDGLTLAVGAPGESNSVNSATTNTHSAGNAGAAYILTLSSSGSPNNQIYLKAPTITANDNFGAAIALSGSGDTLAVGSPYKSSGTGAAYVFTHSGSTWSSPAAISASNAGTGDNFGAVLALDTAGNTLAVGAPYEASNALGVGGTQSNNSAANAGAAYVFSRSGSAWSQQAYVKASNTQANDDFGSALALSSDGSTLAIGAIGESSSATGVGAILSEQADNSKDGVGAVYLFKRSGTAWAQQTYVKPSISTFGDEFGTAIGLSADGRTMAISGAFEQSNATGIGAPLKGTNATGNSHTQSDISTTDAGALWLF